MTIVVERLTLGHSCRKFSVTWSIKFSCNRAETKGTILKAMTGKRLLTHGSSQREIDLATMELGDLKVTQVMMPP